MAAERARSHVCQWWLVVQAVCAAGGSVCVPVCCEKLFLHFIRGQVRAACMLCCLRVCRCVGTEIGCADRSMTVLARYCTCKLVTFLNIRKVWKPK